MKNTEDYFQSVKIAFKRSKNRGKNKYNKNVYLESTLTDIAADSRLIAGKYIKPS